MEDFLNNLAAKSLSVAPILEPRPISRFEPWQPGGELGAAPSHVDVALDVEPASDRVESTDAQLQGVSEVTPQPQVDQTWSSMEHRRAVTSEPIQQTVGREPMRSNNSGAPATASARTNPWQAERMSTESTVSPPASPVVHYIEHIEHAIVEHHRPEIDASNFERRSRVDVEARQATSGAATVGKSIQHDSIERERVVQPLQARSIDISPPAGSAPVLKVEPPGLTERGLPSMLPAVHKQMGSGQPIQADDNQVIARSTPLPVITEDNRAARPLVMPIIERITRTREDYDRDQTAPAGGALRQPINLAERHLSPAPQAAPPTIHVTIGRIEVRATPPAAPVKRASPPATTLTLEEYLRSRAGDRR